MKALSIFPGSQKFAYAKRLLAIRAEYPGSVFVPGDPYAFEVGRIAFELVQKELAAASHQKDDCQLQEESKNDQRLVEVERSKAKSNSRPTEDIFGNPFSPNGAAFAEPQSETIVVGIVNGTTCENEAASSGIEPTLHEAFDGYQEFIKEEYFRPEEGNLTAWGNTQRRQVETLRNHHQNQPLAELDEEAVVKLISYWRRRPYKQGTNKPVTSKSAGNYIKTLKRFLKWLDRTSSFTWRKPFALNDLETRVQVLRSDYENKGLAQVDTFSLEELKLLMRYGQPLDRLLVLLGLNCGFGKAEISSILLNQVHLFSAHDKWHCELMNYTTTDADSFIKRIRLKTGVYGEHLLFKLTVEGLQWAIENRTLNSTESLTGRDVLLVNANGQALDKPVSYTHLTLPTIYSV